MEGVLGNILLRDKFVLEPMLLSPSLQLFPKSQYAFSFGGEQRLSACAHWFVCKPGCKNFFTTSSYIVIRTLLIVVSLLSRS